MKNVALLIFIFNSLLVFALGVSYYLQVNTDAFASQSLAFSYSFNFIITSLFSNLIILFNRTLGQYLGFVFLGQLTLKIILFIIMKKVYIADAFELPWQAFFVAYIICLTTEVTAILYLLKQKGKNEDFSS